MLTNTYMKQICFQLGLICLYLVYNYQKFRQIHIYFDKIQLSFKKIKSFLFGFYSEKRTTKLFGIIIKCIRCKTNFSEFL